MDTSQFDTLVASLSTSSSRRGALRTIGTAAAAGLTAAASFGGAGAKKKKRKKKPETCPVGTLVGTVSVPATGATVTTPVLSQGQRYRLRATGSWSSNATHGLDAFADFEFARPNTTVTVFQGVRLGLSIANGSPDEWGSYNPNHVYERLVTGQNGRLSLRTTDPITTDNAGSITVDVFCA